MLALGFWGKRGVAEQGRTGLDWTGLDRLGRVGGWMDGGGWRGRQFLGRWAADRVGCKGGYGGTSWASINKVSRKEEGE